MSAPVKGTVAVALVAGLLSGCETARDKSQREINAACAGGPVAIERHEKWNAIWWIVKCKDGTERIVR